MKMDQVLDCFDYDDYEKVRSITYNFTNRRRHADTWPNLKREMRSRFVPTSYAQDLYKKLRSHSSLQSVSALGILMAIAKDSSVAIPRIYTIVTSSVGRDYIQVDFRFSINNR
ncbi:hypothetical protein CR513_28617, partial [Mucuna pruriens]